MQLHTQEKVIAGTLIAHGLLGAIWTYSIASRLESPANFFLSNLSLATIGISAGIGWISRRRWGAMLGMFFFAVQLIHIVTPTLRWSFTLGFDFTVSFGWIDSGNFGINVFALTMLVWSASRLVALDRPFRGTSKISVTNTFAEGTAIIQSETNKTVREEVSSP